MKISVSGVRGIYGSDLDLKSVGKFSRLFACSAIESGRKCVIGRDTRPSGRILAQTVIAALLEQGIDVYDLGIAPTPMVFREARKFDAGLMITASHNPLDWNGIKFIIDGRGIFENELDLILKESLSLADNFGTSSNLVSNYINEVSDLIAHTQSTESMRLGLDPGGGAACKYVDQLFKKLGHKFFDVNNVYGISSRDPDPAATNLDELRMMVIKNQLDFGFAFDLDGDRVVVIDNMGKKLNPDVTLLICLASAVSIGLKKFVTSIDTSISVEKYIRKHSCSLFYSKVGEANVVNKILEVGADAGGEGSSAGFIMPRFNMCRDGFLASAIISSLDKKLIDECLWLASQYTQIRSKLPMDSALHSKIMDRLTDSFKKEFSEVLTIDGIKVVIDEDSWVLIRPSNTEHVIRISVESKPENAHSLYKQVNEKVMLLYDQLR